MNRGDILAKLQSTSAAETRTLSITDAAIQNATDTNALNAFDAQSVFKLISSASDLEQRFDLDKETDSTKGDMQTATKNKRKNFKPRNATTSNDNATVDPSLTDQFILNLMMQNQMKKLQQEFNQGQLKRCTDDAAKALEHQLQHSSGGESERTNNNDSCNSLKSPPSSPLTNGHANAGGMSYFIDFSIASFEF